ncbi:MAG: tRNA uridine-5-carboxymethylaminomethyl(34) synthesis GTPase MnmE [Erysipelotrichaceae bacterium]
MLNDTIVAVATALSESAISIIKVSGEEAIEVVNRIFSRDLMKAKSHTVHYGKILDQEEEIDEVLVSIFRAPKTFTAEDVVEINCHGGVYITRKILSLCLANGARLALNGEFTQRAYLNGRIDLSQAESIHDMIGAKNETNIKLAMKGINGSIRKLIDPLLIDLLNIIAQIEVNIDYPEYDDVEVMTSEVILPKANQWLKEIDVILKRANSTRRMKQGVKTAIVGKPNVGKSSLLNALLQEDKAIVTDIAGTTRDLVEGYINLDHVTLHLIDTAGIRETEDVVEKIGIDRSIQAIEEAELCIVLLDGSNQLDTQDEELLEMTKDKQRLVVYNKHDLNKKDNEITISALNEDIEALVDAINELYQEDYQVLDAPSLNNERQISCLIQARDEMKIAIDSMENGFELDLVTINLQEAYYSLKDILGQRNKTDLIDTLFRNFCLGK